MNSIYKNPIIPGYYPDPSICRVEEDFYMVCSSFEMYPGIPVFHSRDLVHWEQICNAMNMDNDFHVDVNCGIGGVMAPTIRYNRGRFYIINANFADKGNFIVSAENPAGPWSMPVYLDDVPGIDASLFFDNDGACYIMGTGNVWDNGTGVKERGIWAAPYDIENYRMLGDPVTIYNSAMRNASSPESPHLYHIGDYYYLVIAEGGTEHYHSVAVARSKEILGFYEGNPANPVMTHRMMGTYAKIANVGHADLVDTPDGSWYAVMLASRCMDGVYKNLGRETYMCPVIWEWDWPLFSPETGRLEFEYHAPNLETCIYPAYAEKEDFEKNELPLHFIHYGTPYEKYYEIDNSQLKIECIPQRLINKLRPMAMSQERRRDTFWPFIGRRQTEFDTDVSCKMSFVPRGNETAGIAIIQAFNHQLHLERACVDGQQTVRCVLCTTDYEGLPFLPHFRAETHEEVVASAAWEGQDVVLLFQLRGKKITVCYGQDAGDLIELCKVDGTLINTVKVGCMTGTVIGMYATGNGAHVDNRAGFDWFCMENK